MLRRFIELFRRPEPVIDIASLTHQASLNNRSSQRKLGIALVKGDIVGKNISHGLLWLAKAANAGDIEAHQYIYLNKIVRTGDDFIQALPSADLTTIASSMNRARDRFRLENSNLDCFISILNVSIAGFDNNQKQSLHSFLAACDFGVSETMSEFLKTLRDQLPIPQPLILIAANDASSVSTSSSSITTPAEALPLAHHQNHL